MQNSHIGLEVMSVTGRWRCTDVGKRVFVAIRLIEKSAIQVLVPYQQYREEFDELRQQQDKEGINDQWFRKSQGITVSVYRQQSGHQNLIPAKLHYGKGVSDEVLSKRLSSPNAFIGDPVFSAS